LRFQFPRLLPAQPFQIHQRQPIRGAASADA
jgi:hypothetical protein